jgi:hypothetical protein
VLDPEGLPVAAARVLARTYREVGGRRIEWMLALEGPALATTGPDGRFAIARPPAALVALVFLADGFAATERKGLDAQAGATHDLTIRLARGRGLRGTVSDTDGRPIAGARVAIAPPAGSDAQDTPNQSATTDAAGAYVLASLPSLPGRAWVSARGYRSELGLDTAAWGDRKDLTLRREALLVDVVEAEGGAPIADARGTLWQTAPRARLGLLEPWRHASEAGYADMPGRLELWVTADGRWMLPAAGVEPLEAEAVVFAAAHRSARVRLILRAGEEPPHLRVPLARGEEEVALAGVVANGEGARITVSLAAPKEQTTTADHELRPLRTLAAAPGGRFEVRGLPPDRYHLRAEAEGRFPTGLEVDAPALDLVLAFVATGRLDVRVVSSDGAPQSGVPVSVEPAEGRTVLSETTAADGVARFAAVPAGVAVAAPRRVRSLGGAAQHPSVMRATVVEGETVRIDLLLPARVRHVLRVLDEAGKAVEGQAIALDGWGFAGAADELDRVSGLVLVTDAEGRCALDLFPGSYRATLALPSGGGLQVSVLVALRPGPEQVIHAVRAGVTLRGRVLEEGSEQPVADRPVFVNRPDALRSVDRLGRAMTDADGRFEIAGLPPGRVRLLLALQGRGEDARSDPDSPWPTAHVEVDLDATRDELVVHVPRARGPGAVERTVPLALRVTSAQDGAPLDGASAYALVLRGGLWVHAGDVRTDATGRGEGRLIGGQRYRVFVSGRWSPKPPRWKGVELERSPAAGGLEVEIALEPEDAEPR